jgi:hypothetical protein
MNPQQPMQETIAERAYSLWEQAGQPTGRDEEFWLRAETELAAAAGTEGAPSIIAPPPVTPPASAGALPPHDVPSPSKDAVKIPGRRPPRPRAPKRG